MKEMKDKQVLIVGMARSGVAAARMLSRLGAKLTLTDTRNSEQMASAIEQLSDIDANWQLGVEPDALIEDKDYIILSPSVYYWAPWVEKAKQNGTEVVSELQLGAWFTQGDFVAVLGHNGSGKSTFAKHLNALVMPTEGTVWVDGMDTREEENTLKVRQTAGMVFQNPDNQIVGTLVDEEVGFGPENIGVPTEEIWERVEKSLKAVGMYAFRNQSPNKLSGGQKQRVAIAGIVAMKPKCIVLDEPTAMLDPLGRKDVLNVLHELNRQENVTVILITHYMEEVIDIDKLYVMDDGKLVMSGTPREIFSQVEKLKKLRLDVPHVTELAYELQKEGVPLKNGILTSEEFTEELIRVRNEGFNVNNSR